ncbi:MAG: hypothetical protein U0Y68_19525 [Blastocatellia bacterium]
MICPRGQHPQPHHSAHRSRVPYPHQGNSIHLTVGTSDYHAMQLQVTRQFANGLQFNAHYTWSKILK